MKPSTWPSQWLELTKRRAFGLIDGGDQAIDLTKPRAFWFGQVDGLIVPVDQAKGPSSRATGLAKLMA